MKFVHSQLPTGARRHLQSQVKDDNLWLCPCCKQSKETIPHILQCSSNPEFTSSLEKLRERICQHETHPVCHLLYAGIWHFATQPHISFQPDLESYPAHLRSSLSDALESQSEIGWYQATKGLLSKKWRELASQSMFQVGQIDATKGLTSMLRIMNAIHDHSIRMWLSRNQVLHSKEDTDLDRIRSAATAEITLMHGQPEFMCTADRYLCSRSLSSLLSSSPSTRRRWLSRVKVSRERHSKDGTRQPLITSFFRTPA
jgi:hypothetical protein